MVTANDARLCSAVGCFKMASHVVVDHKGRQRYICEYHQRVRHNNKNAVEINMEIK
jgi:hypothetical protein